MTAPFTAPYAPIYAGSSTFGKQNGKRHAWLIVGASLAAHVLLIFIASVSTGDPEVVPRKPIAAHLVVVRAAPTVQTEPGSPDRPATDTATPPPASANPAPSDQAMPPEPSLAQSGPSQDDSAAPDAETTTDADIPRATPSARRIDPRAALDSFMHAQQQQAVRQAGAEAAMAFAQQQRSPILSDPRKGLPQSDTAEGPTPIRVNCNSGLNETLAVLSVLTGGSVRCSTLPDLAPHLDKHLKRPAKQ